ncbi:hypothetical protein HYALB_00005533 [Hymenoscyphus albidus]|uniref:Uncharacterized protein n=1 Tax=Hymenoscyphus albidus TaxID=595503 RepID=A0A9N9QD88_9HELO|nr:hypothetical protein HYALB_00005533 [Hymenoscyphus albidus]
MGMDLGLVIRPENLRRPRISPQMRFLNSYKMTFWFSISDAVMMLEMPFFPRENKPRKREYSANVQGLNNYGKQENKPVVDEFKRLRAAWKIHAQANSSQALENLSARVQGMKKIKPQQSELYKRRVLWEHNILQKEAEKTPEIGSMGCFSGLSQLLGLKTKKKDHGQAKKNEEATLDDSPCKKPERPKPHDSYGISVSKITLEKSSTSSSYMNSGIERYDLHKVLYDKENNPLRRMASTDNPNTIRYFHFPSNNMHWIEEAIGRYYDEDTPGETTGGALKDVAKSPPIFCVGNTGHHSSSKSANLYPSVTPCLGMRSIAQVSHNSRGVVRQTNVVLGIGVKVFKPGLIFVSWRR